jgi:ABC-2 type transport system permease protein
MLLTTTRLELVKIFSKPRSYIGFAAITVIVSIIQFAMYAGGKEYIDFVVQPLKDMFSVEGKVLNGSLVSFVILQMLIIQIPLLVALVTGDLVSGEAAMGTVRLMVTRPVSRMQIIMAKFLAGNIYIILLLLWLMLASIGLGTLLFGTGDLIVLNTDVLVILKDGDIMWRFFSAFGISFLGMMVVGSLSLCLSCFSENSIGPIISTMAVIILFTIIGALEIPLLNGFKPFMFTTHMAIWRSMFDNPVPTAKVLQSVAVLAGHVVLFLTVALISFKRKDILS